MTVHSSEDRLNSKRISIYGDSQVNIVIRNKSSNYLTDSVLKTYFVHLSKINDHDDQDIKVLKINEYTKEWSDIPIYIFDESTVDYLDLLVFGKFFPSKSQAMKAGWKKEIPIGYTNVGIGKLKRRLVVLNEISNSSYGSSFILPIDSVDIESDPTDLELHISDLLSMPSQR